MNIQVILEVGVVRRGVFQMIHSTVRDNMYCEQLISPLGKFRFTSIRP